MIVLPVFCETPHLMLYFDVNKTLIATDKAGGKSLENVLNGALASKYKYRWDATITEPVSYENYIRDNLLPGPAHDLELKKKRKAYLDHFVDYLEEQNHPLYPEVQSIYAIALEKLKNSKESVFPSFYQLLKRLDQEKISYTLFLRSFGSELFEIAEEINTVCGNIFMNSGSFIEGRLVIAGEIVGNDISEIYAVLRSSTHMEIQDDWKYWMSGETASAFGKPFIIDQSDPSILGIFFDDNIDLNNTEKNIIAPIDVSSKLPISIQELIKRNQLVCVDTLNAILNDNYFVELVNQALSEHNEVKKEKSKSH
jgi:hypothetical protein